MATALPGNLRTARKAAGLSQEALARSVDVSVLTVARAEQGRNVPRADVLTRIAAKLETTVESLLSAEAS